jgi:hypothetical protein
VANLMTSVSFISVETKTEKKKGYELVISLSTVPE